VWRVQLQAEVTGPGRRPSGNDALEPMLELMQRTEGVRAAAALALHAGPAVDVCLAALDAATAAERARALVASCARYAGLGEVTIDRVRVAPATAPGRCEV
jgi:hypothetical protein